MQNEKGLTPYIDSFLCLMKCDVCIIETVLDAWAFTHILCIENQLQYEQALLLCEARVGGRYEIETKEFLI